MSTTPTLAYITPHHNGYQVRLPQRVGGFSKFFSGQESALKAACAWRDRAFDQAGMPITTRVANCPNAGVNMVTDARTGDRYVAAVWMYEDKQMKRMFPVEKNGLRIAYIMAYMARDLGIRAEADRQAGMVHTTLPSL